MIGLTVQTVLGIFVVLWLFNMRREAREEKMIHIVTLIQTSLFVVVFLIFYFTSINKLNMLWAIPGSWLFSYILGFLIMRVPVLRTILRYIFLAFGSIFLFGIDTTIQGTPNAK